MEDDGDPGGLRLRHNLLKVLAVLDNLESVMRAQLVRAQHTATVSERLGGADSRVSRKRARPWDGGDDDDDKEEEQDNKEGDVQ